MTKDEALRLAMDALADADYEMGDEAITAIKGALEVPEEKYTYGTPLLDAMTKDYVSPQRTWVGLTPEDTFEIGERLGLSDIAWVDLMEAIEAKLKELNS